MRKLAYIAKVSDISPIEGADRLEVARLQGHGWKVVVGKGDFRVGDVCVMFEIDSFLNADDERYAFLRDRCLKKFVSKGGNVLAEGMRIKTIKLRGVVSQGLIMPIDRFPEVTDQIVWDADKGCDMFVSKGGKAEVAIGADVTSILKVEHYDDLREMLQPAMGSPTGGDAMGPFPSAIPKTDEERIQNLDEWFGTMKGRTWQVTVKHDGTSCTVAYALSIDKDNPEIVCSRNQRMKPAAANGKVPVYWEVAEKYDVVEQARRYFEKTGHEIAFQGEAVGPGIQSDKNKENEHVFRCFRIWDITDQEWIAPQETEEICRRLKIPHVQVIERNFPFFDKITTMEDALKFAEGKTEEGNEREGVVLKTDDGGKYASFKIVSNRYLLKE